MTPGLCSMIKIEDVSEPCTEAPHRVAEALLLFCQVVFMIFITINRLIIHNIFIRVLACYLLWEEGSQDKAVWTVGMVILFRGSQTFLDIPYIDFFQEELWHRGML